MQRIMCALVVLASGFGFGCDPYERYIYPHSLHHTIVKEMMGKEAQKGGMDIVQEFPQFPPADDWYELATPEFVYRTHQAVMGILSEDDTCENSRRELRALGIDTNFDCEADAVTYDQYLDFWASIDAYIDAPANSQDIVRLALVIGRQEYWHSKEVNQTVNDVLIQEAPPSWDATNYLSQTTPPTWNQLAELIPEAGSCDDSLPPTRRSLVRCMWTLQINDLAL